MRDFATVRAELDRARREHRNIDQEATAIRGRINNGEDNDGLRERLTNLERGLSERDLRIAELEQEAGQALLDHASRDNTTEAGADLPGSGRVATGPGIASEQSARDEALRTIDRYTRSGELRSAAADRLNDLVRKPDPMALDTRYIAAVGNPAYASAFGKMLKDPQSGQLRFSPEEVEAVRLVSQAQEMRGMVEGTGSAGGFAIPFTLDPSILLTSSGALNPVRDVARVISISTREWKGVSSAGVTASYDAEASEVSDDTPTLAQPNVVTAMGRAFVPFSIELDMDWPGLSSELQRLIAEARDELDAGKFLTGSGTDEPAGVLTGLTTTQRVQTASAATFAIGDSYALKAALPARFVPRASFAAHPSTLDVIYRQAGGGSTEPQPLPERDGNWLGVRKLEWGNLATGASTGTKLAIYGDFSNFVIADRIGMTAEIVNHLFGANRRPTGERGLFCYWRTGSKVVVPNAFRYLEVA